MRQVTNLKQWRSHRRSRFSAMAFAVYIVAMSMGLSAAAQSVLRHPRVLEVERLLYNDLQTTVRDLIPGHSFHLKVKVEPLRRAEVGRSSGKDSLPYFEARDEILDEWDDPARTDFELLSRVNRISVRATIPDVLTDQQKEEVKAAITSRVPYVDGRDLVEIEARAFPATEVNPHRYTSWILGMGVALMFALGLVGLVLAWITTNRLGRAIQNIKISNSENSSSASAPLPLPPIANTNPNQSGKGVSNRQVQLNDTIRMTEVIFGLIKEFETNDSFPCMEDMIIWDQYFKKSPSSAGGLLAEFPTALKTHVFSYSASIDWLKGMTNPGDIDSIAFELMNKLVRIERKPEETSWNRLLVACWRLDDKLASFLKRVDPQDSLLILRALPQSLALQAAREVMPGEWAAVLKHAGPRRTMSPERIEKYMGMALDTLPLRDFSMIQQYRKDVDLVKYMQIVDPSFEREIYGALPADSTLQSLRPPFFPLLDASIDELREFSVRVGLEDWALALMNVSRTIRGHVEATLTDKQKLRLTELLRRYDRSGVSPDHIGQARDRIGRAYRDFQNAKSFAGTPAKLNPEVGRSDAA